MVSAALMERIGVVIVKFHGHREHAGLIEALRQIESLDRFADAEDACAHVGALHAKYRSAREEADQLRAAERDRAQREDLLRFQVRELDAAGLQEGEEEALRSELRRVQHAERFNAGVAECVALLDEAPQSASERLARAAPVVQDLSRLHPAFPPPGEAIEAPRIQLD